MEDKQIVELYWKRSEHAVSETAEKYGRFCYGIAYRILANEQDSEECVNDTWLHAWNAMPPSRPDRLSAFLGRITRNLSLNTYKHYRADKRGGGQTSLVLEELQECIPSAESVDERIDELVTVNAINEFLSALPEDARKIFMRRYWYLDPIADIAARYRISESGVKMSLLRSRNRLKEQLEKAGVSL